MYLKEVEINGFKSFANKINFKFNQGITAIVGPNGSGKSNVVDAIRWVLGEQKIKQLRGEKMEDVIFAGTEQRKSHGFAFVSITFDNSDRSLEADFDEVKVSRKLYRSGESEYRLNDNICRLKDIHEIFYDTGIGKEGYSIIGQGQIERILSGKPESRRELVDEAIGIVKFKKRKLEANRKLENDNINILRLKDILLEMENQLNPLKEQASKAKKYIEVKEELKKLEIFDFSTSYIELKGNLEKLEKDIDIINSQIEESKNNYEKSKLENNEFENKLTQFKIEIENINSKIHNILQEMNDISSEEILLSQENDFKLKSNNDLYELLNKNILLIKEKKIEIENSINELNRLEISINQNKINLADIDIEYSGLKSNIDNLNTLLKNKRTELENITKKELELATNLSYSEAKIEYENSEKKKIEDNFNRLINEKKDLKHKIDKLDSNLIIINSKKEQLNKDILFLTDELNLNNELNSNISNEIDKVNINITTVKSRLELLINIATRYEGYGNAVKLLMDKYSKNPDNLGVVANLVNVDKEYEIAIESALGGSLQHIVTSNTKCAKEMLTTLKDNKWGKVTFLPLDNLKPGRVLAKRSLPSDDGIIGIASDLVTYKSGLDVLINYLLANTIIVKNIDVALKLNKNKFQSRIVTLDGEIIMPAGSISGGSYKNSTNLLSRKREINKLQEKLDQLLIEEKKLEKDKGNNDQRIGDLTNLLKEKNDLLSNLSIEKIKIQENINSLNSMIKKIDIELENINTKEINDSIVDIDDLKDNYNNILSQKENVNYEIGTIQKSIDEKVKYYENLLNNINNLQLLIDKDKGKKSVIEETIKRLNKEISNFNKDNTELDNKINNNTNLIEKNKDRIIHLNNNYEGKKAIHSDLIEELKKVEAENQKLLSQNSLLYEEREKLNNIILDLEKNKLRLTNSYSNTETKFNTKVAYMWDEYGLTYSETKDIKADINSNNVESDIQKLRNKIRNFGSINVAAVEEYRSLNDRYNFYKKQLDDILQSKENLQKIIKSLDKNMVDQFNNNFYKLENQLEKVFKELFGGGRVKMELTDPDNILESGININAQPPGKKLQNMLQLSGGEKALTAISLMFAIQNMNPSPFCFLDEIEAALDDHNVIRFSEYLSNLVNKTQFIVITHRKGTMQAADRLYGVTMQEKGISTLVSVELV